MSKNDNGLTALSSRIASELIMDITSGEVEAGSHISAQKIADRFGVSRTPVREALSALTEQGFLESKTNRGVFVAASDSWQVGAVPTEGDQPFEKPGDYQRIADDWLAGQLPSELTEQYLLDRYSLTRSQLNDILMRAVREGWAERKQGYGWRLLKVASTVDAFEQIYRFRILIEPGAMLEPTYAPDPAVLDRLRRSHERMLESGIERLPGEKLLDFGARFHEEIIAFSRNPYFEQSLIRVNRLRRLMEYRARVDRSKLYVQWAQHIEIIDLIDKADISGAAYLLRQHLSGALAQKSPVIQSRLGATGSD